MEIIAARIRSQLRLYGHQVRWIAALARNGVTSSEPSDQDCIAIPMWDGIRIATDLAWPLPSPCQLGMFWREVSFADLIHLHEPFYPACQIVFWCARFQGKPVVVTQHIADMPVPGRMRRMAVAAANALLTRPAHRRADSIVFYSARTRSFFKSSTAGKSQFIHNGCDTELFRPLEMTALPELRRSLDLPGDRPVILFVGRFIAKKGLCVLKEVASARPHLNFIFIGIGPMSPLAWNFPNVRVVPPCSHAFLSRFYQASDLLVLPAVGEGFPLVVQEAMCSGLPCLVSDEIAEACPEMKDDFILAGRAGSDTLAAIDAFLHKNCCWNARLNMAERARRLWAWKVCGEQYNELFQQIVTERSKT